MGAQENKQAAEDAYRAFSNGDGEAAMKDMDDSIKWTVRGDNALTGTYNGKQAVGELWGKFMSKDFRTEPHDYVADGDKVVVACDDGRRAEGSHAVFTIGFVPNSASLNCAAAGVTVDDLDRMRKLVATGVTGICSNDPRLFAELS